MKIEKSLLLQQYQESQMRNIFHFLFIVLFTIFTTSNSETELEKFRFLPLPNYSIIGSLLPSLCPDQKNQYQCLKDLGFTPITIKPPKNWIGLNLVYGIWFKKLYFILYPWIYELIIPITIILRKSEFISFFSPWITIGPM